MENKSWCQIRTRRMTLRLFERYPYRHILLILHLYCETDLFTDVIITQYYVRAIFRADGRPYIIIRQPEKFFE